MCYKILLILLSIIFIISLIIKRFAYFRPTYDFISPKDNYEDIREGNLHAWYKRGTSNKIILFCHGNAGNISYRQNKLMEISKLGHSFIIFDYSGFGQSRGVPSEQMCYANADMFIRFLFRKGFKKEDIIPYGESLGAAVASHVAKKYGLPAVIIESGLPSIKDIVNYWYPNLGIVLGLIFNEFDTISYLKDYKGKILVMHCINDENVPYKLANKFRELATLFIEMDGSHNNPIIPWNILNNFIII